MGNFFMECGFWTKKNRRKAVLVDLKGYLQTFCHCPFTCRYWHPLVPSGGKETDGRGFNVTGGSAGNGATLVDGRSSVLEHISL
jgi:hypothetical protein